MKSQMTIGRKLTLCFAGMLALTLVLGYAALSTVGSLSKELKTAVTSTAKKLSDCAGFKTNESEMVSIERDIALRTLIKDSATVARYLREYETKEAAAAKTLKDIRGSQVSEAGRRAVDAVEASMSAWQEVHRELIEACKSGKDANTIVTLIADKIVPNADRVSKAADELIAQQQALLDTSEKDADEKGASGRWIALLLTGLSMLAGAAVLFVVRQSTRELQQLTTQMSEGAGQVANAAMQVSGSSQSLAQGASEQAASLEETSATTEEIHSMTNKNADNTQGVASLMQTTAGTVEEANHSLAQMVVSMQEINTSSDKISKIIKVIDEIAFQTNILALNAAVEAARAGEAGMGFAVVADEVRNLAQRCAQAAKDTAGLIEESIAKSNDGKIKLDQVAHAVHSITESASKVKILVDEVNLGSQEQARGIEQISKAVAQMEQVTQRTAANAEESASAGEELSAQAEAMRGVVERLSGLVGTNQSAVGAARPVRLREKVARPSEGMSSRAKAPAGSDSKTPALAMVKADKHAIPMDDDFKEF